MLVLYGSCGMMSSPPLPQFDSVGSQRESESVLYEGGTAMTSPQWCFDGFRLDPDHACLWRGAEALALTPKAFAVLHYLVTHPHRLISKDELLDAVWPEVAVTEAVLRVTIGMVRKVLGDPAQTPRFIATMPRRGYRFLAPVIEDTGGAPGPAAPVTLTPPETSATGPLEAPA